MVRMLSASSVPPHHSPPIGQVPRPRTDTMTPLRPSARVSITPFVSSYRNLPDVQVHSSHGRGFAYAGKTHGSRQRGSILDTADRQPLDQVALREKDEE